MNKILNIEESIEVAKKLREQNKKIVLAGGCFDIVHVGHTEFFKNAKAQGDILMLLLESDEKIQKSKGENRPIFTQSMRAKVLSEIQSVDYVVTLPPVLDNNEYDALITKIHPSCIATTAGDPQRTHKERQGKLLSIPVIDVIKPIVDKSTSKIIELLASEL